MIPGLIHCWMLLRLCRGGLVLILGGLLCLFRANGFALGFIGLGLSLVSLMLLFQLGLGPFAILLIRLTGKRGGCQ